MSKRLEANATLRAFAHLHAQMVAAGLGGPDPERKVRGSTEWAVIAALVSYSRRAQPVWPSQFELAAVAHLSVRSVQRALKWLIERGFVRVVVVPLRDRFRGNRTAYALPIEPTAPVTSADWSDLDSVRREKWRDRDPKRRAQKAREAAAEAAAAEADARAAATDPAARARHEQRRWDAGYVAGSIREIELDAAEAAELLALEAAQAAAEAAAAAAGNPGAPALFLEPAQPQTEPVPLALASRLITVCGASDSPNGRGGTTVGHGNVSFRESGRSAPTAARCLDAAPPRDTAPTMAVASGHGTEQQQRSDATDPASAPDAPAGVGGRRDPSQPPPGAVARIRGDGVCAADGGNDQPGPGVPPRRFPRGFPLIGPPSHTTDGRTKGSPPSGGNLPSALRAHEERGGPAPAPTLGRRERIRREFPLLPMGSEPDPLLGPDSKPRTSGRGFQRENPTESERRESLTDALDAGPTAVGEARNAPNAGTRQDAAAAEATGRDSPGARPGWERALRGEHTPTVEGGAVVDLDGVDQLRAVEAAAVVDLADVDQLRAVVDLADVDQLRAVEGVEAAAVVDLADVDQLRAVEGVEAAAVDQLRAVEGVARAPVTPTGAQVQPRRTTR